MYFKKTFVVLTASLLSFSSLVALDRSSESADLHVSAAPPRASSVPVPSFSLRTGCQALATALLAVFTPTPTLACSSHEPSSRKTPWLENVTLPAWEADTRAYCKSLYTPPIQGSRIPYLHNVSKCFDRQINQVYLAAAEGDDKVAAIAQYRIGAEYYRGGVGIDQNTTAFISYMNRSATIGFTPAQVALGNHFYYTDLPQSLLWLESAARQHDPDAAPRVCVPYLTNSTIGINETLAVELYQSSKGVDAGEAYREFATMFDTGYLVSQNVSRAMGLYSAAAGRNNTVALVYMSKAYFDGTRVPKNDSLSFELAKRACDAGDREGMIITAEKYLNGIGVTTNVTEAVRLYSEISKVFYSSKDDVGRACFILGNLYEFGRGEVLTPNVTLSQLYYELAYYHGIPEAAGKLIRTSASPTPSLTALPTHPASATQTSSYSGSVTSTPSSLP